MKSSANTDLETIKSIWLHTFIYLLYEIIDYFWHVCVAVNYSSVNHSYCWIFMSFHSLCLQKQHLIEMLRWALLSAVRFAQVITKRLWYNIQWCTLLWCTANRLIACWGRTSDQGRTCLENCYRRRTTPVTSEAARCVISLLMFKPMFFSANRLHFQHGDAVNE